MLYAHIRLISNCGRRELTRRVLVESVEDYKARKSELQEWAVLQICASRSMTPTHLRMFGYTQTGVKFEEVNK